MYYYGYNSGYSYGSPNNTYQACQNNGNSGAIILVLFILLVIIIGSRLINNSN